MTNATPPLDTPASDKHRLLIGVAVAIILHLLLAAAAVFSPRVEAAPGDPEVLDRMQVQTFEQDILLPKPTIVPETAPEPKVEPEPTTVPPATARPEESAPAPTPKPRPKRKRPRKPKRVQAPSPKTVVLSRTIEGGGVSVYGGGEDVLGDPSVAATPSSTTVPPPSPPNTAPGGTGQGGTGTGAVGSGRLIMPDLRAKVSEADKRYPANAPRLGKPIRITLSLLVTTDGRTRLIQVVQRTSGAKRHFDAAAIKLVKKLRFRPATLGGVPIEKRIRWVVTYRPN